jgi:phage terminase large subunit-like protein
MIDATILQHRLAEAERIAARLVQLRALEYHPHPGQEPFHRSTARIRAIYTGNRFGKSWAAAKECDWWATGRHPYRDTRPVPCRIRVVGDGFDYGIKEIILPIFRRLVNPTDLLGGDWDHAYSKGDRTLTYANGSTIQFMSYKLGEMGSGAQKFAGVELDLFWFDEHGPQDVWAENMARVGSRGPVHAINTLTPILGKTWEHGEIWEKWEKGDPDIACFTGSIHDNPHLGEGAAEGVVAGEPDPEMREVREHGTWINLGGQVYPMFNRERHVVPFDAVRVRQSTKSLLIDPHPSRAKGHHLLWCGVDADQRMFCYREKVYRQPIPEISDAVRAECMADKSLNEDIRRFWIDCHWGWKENESGKSIAEQYRECGIPVQPASNDKTGGIQLMQTALEVSPTTRRPMFEVMDTCPETARQFERYSWKPQTTAMRESDRWKTIDELDDFVTLARYYVQTNPRFAGRRGRKAAQVLSVTDRWIMGEEF